MVNGKSTACHELDLVFNLNQKVLKFYIFLSNTSLHLSVSVLEPFFIYFYIVQLFSKHEFHMLMEDLFPVVNMFACSDRVSIFYILSVVVQSYVKRNFRLSNILYFAEQTFL